MEAITELLADYSEGNASVHKGHFTTGWHRLPFHACGQVTKGRWKFELAGRRRVVVNEGEGFFLRAGLMHLSEKFTKSLTIVSWAHFGASAGRRGDPLLRMNIPMLFAGKPAKRVGDLCTELADVPPGAISISTMARRQARLYELVAVLTKLGEDQVEEIPRELLSKEHGLEVELTRLAPAIDLIRQYHFLELDIEKLAAAVHLSTTRFRIVFRRVTGLPPHRYQHLLRLDVAKTLLARTDEPVKIVAQRIGHHNPCLFSRLFRRDVGMTPLDYRRQTRTNVGMLGRSQSL
jgi:AraC-like DNA-binding protein